MKKTKSKSSKPAKGGKSKSPKRAAKKELESGIAERFLEVVTNLGHDAERIAKDIKKMSKEIAKKLSEKIKAEKSKKEKDKKEQVKREVKGSNQAAAKPASRAEKVVARIAKPKAVAATKRSPQVTSTDVVPSPRRRRTTSVTDTDKQAPVRGRPRKPAVAPQEKAEDPKPLETENGSQNVPEPTEVQADNQ
jgi:hypothetical protein